MNVVRLRGATDEASFPTRGSYLYRNAVDDNLPAAAEDHVWAAEEHQPPLEQFAVTGDGHVLFVPVTFEGTKHLCELDARVLGHWSGYVITFDSPNGSMYLKKGEQAHPPNDLDMRGLHILRIGRQTVVHSVNEESAAARIGIRASDVLVSIDGDKANQLLIFALRRRFCSKGEQLHDAVLRAGEAIKVTTVLGSLKGPASP